MFWFCGETNAVEPTNEGAKGPTTEKDALRV
jgi:hypothetical protein